MTHLTESAESLWDDIVTGLAAEGFTFAPLTETRTAFLARALGSPSAYLTKPFAQLLAELNPQFDGAAVSYLTTGVAELLSTLATTLEGGGEEPEAYDAPAVRFAEAYLLRNTAITATNHSQGFLSTFLYIDTSDAQAATIIRNSDSTILITINTSGGMHVEMADVEYNSYIYLDADAGSFPVNEWFHFILAWDMGFAVESRRIAAYSNRIAVELTVDDEFGGTFDVGVVQPSFTELLNSSGFPGVNQWADFGLWVGSTVVQAGNTILSADLDKFVDADGKPVDPTNWPASPVLKFSGDATGFLTNQGSGGAFAISGSGTVSNASTSPSD